MSMNPNSTSNFRYHTANLFQVHMTRNRNHGVFEITEDAEANEKARVPYMLQQLACLILKCAGLQDIGFQMALPNVFLQFPHGHSFPHEFLH